MTTTPALIQSGYIPGDYAIDTDRSTISFRGRSLWGLLSVRGTFAEFTGTGRLREDGTVTGQLVINVPSVRTGIGKRDRHLLSSDFFDADRHPVITFTIADLRLLPTGEAVAEGDLQIKDAVEQVLLPAGLKATNGHTVHLDCRTTFDRRAFGISINQFGMLSDTVEINAQLRWTRTR